MKVDPLFDMPSEKPADLTPSWASGSIYKPSVNTLRLWVQKAGEWEDLGIISPNEATLEYSEPEYDFTTLQGISYYQTLTPKVTLTLRGITMDIEAYKIMTGTE